MAIWILLIIRMVEFFKFLHSVFIVRKQISQIDSDDSNFFQFIMHHINQSVYLINIPKSFYSTPFLS